MKYFFYNQYNYNYQFPVYPYLLFLLYNLFGIIPKAGIILNCVFHSLSALLGFQVFHWFTSRSRIQVVKDHALPISFITSLGILFHPLINYYTLMIIHPFSLDLLMMVVSLFLMIRYLKKSDTRNIIIFGFAFGLTLLNRTSFIVLIFPFFLSLILTHSFIHAFRKSFIVLLIGITFLSPWLYRNYSIYHKLSLISSVGLNLWLGIQEKTEGGASLPDGNPYHLIIPSNEWPDIIHLNSEEQSDYFLKKYKKIVVNEPMHVLKMYVIKLKNFWAFRSKIGIEYSNEIKRLIPFYKWGYVIVLFLAIYFLAKSPRDALIIFSIPISLSLLQAIFYVETRHRVIIEPLLLFMATCTVYILNNILSRKKNV
ncbi:MAG: glycosyltransferase family 39 protein [Bacteroidetes bacterium]|nr:glycosyltransferase family 39 protein [Bacteroidota bacterium]